MSDTLWETDGTVDIQTGNRPTPAQLNDTIQIGASPIGSIVGWTKTITGVPSLPNGWIECDGSVISDAESPLNGQTLPDLNGNNNFLRGSTTSGTTGGSATHTHNFSAGGGSGQIVLSGTAVTDPRQSVNNEPPYYNIVFIMRYK